MYSHSEVYEASLEYFNGDELAASVFADKYALRDKNHNILEKTPDDMHRRLAKEFARIESRYSNPVSYDAIYSLLKNFSYLIPQGSPMASVGNTHQLLSASNCFVIDQPFDAYSGILKTDQELAQIMKRRGGVGFDLSTLRQQGATTTNAAMTSTGIGTFMERYSNTTREVAQDGRRGALMLCISVHHPEIETFINIKRDRKKVTGANVSIRITDAFMNALESGEEYDLIFNDKIVGKKSAKIVWDKIIESAWESAEPGVLFWDTIVRESPADIYSKYGYRTKATNPCAELPLSAYDSCRLLAINLMLYVVYPFTDKAYFDYDLFRDHAIIAQRIMDDLVDIEIEQVNKIIEKVKSDPEPDDVKAVELALWEKILTAVVNGRRTGLGITALGDAIASLGMKYGDENSISEIEKIYKTLGVASYYSSSILAEERGHFPVYDHALEKNHVFIKRILSASKEVKGCEDLEVRYKKHGRRNIANLTTAPTGSVSTMTQTTSGIEPAYLLSYTRKKKINPSDKDASVDFVDELGDKWQKFTVYHHGLKKWMDVTGKTDVKDSPYYGSTSQDIDIEESVKVQAVAQKYVDHAISKTANAPSHIEKNVVSKLYMQAYKLGCKGFTFYREGSRDGVLTSNEEETKKEISYASIPPRPSALICDIHQIKVKSMSWVCFVSMYLGKPYEIFTGLEDNILPPKKLKSGVIVKRNGGSRSKYDLYFNKDQESEVVFKDLGSHFKNEDYAAQTRLISLSLRAGVPLHEIVEQLQKIENEDMFSFNKVISRVLKNYIEDGTTHGKSCPQCGEKAMAYQEGCVRCSACGWSKC